MTRDRHRGYRWAGALLSAAAVVLLNHAALSQNPPRKPRVPPGVDPGGVAIAVIGNGVDYTRPEVASRLARDGEGEIVGWDFVDNDRQPFDRCKDSARPCILHPLMAALGERGVSARLVVVRADPTMPQTLVQAMRLVGQLPVRIAVLSAAGGTLPRAFLDEAAARFPNVLLIADASSVTPPEAGQSTSDNLRISAAWDGLAAEAASHLASDANLDAAGLSKRLRNPEPRVP